MADFRLRPLLVCLLQWPFIADNFRLQKQTTTRVGSRIMRYPLLADCLNFYGRMLLVLDHEILIQLWRVHPIFVFIFLTRTLLARDL